MTNLSVIKELASPERGERWVRLVFDDVVRADGRERGAGDAEGAPLQLDDVLLEDDLRAGGHVTPQAVLVKTVPDVFLNLVHRVAQLL